MLRTVFQTGVTALALLAADTPAGLKISGRFTQSVSF